MTWLLLLAWVNDPARVTAELQAACTGLGLPPTGNRTQLTTKLRNHIGSQPDLTAPSPWTPTGWTPPAPPPPVPTPTPAPTTDNRDWLWPATLALLGLFALIAFLVWSPWNNNDSSDGYTPPIETTVPPTMAPTPTAPPQTVAPAPTPTMAPTPTTPTVAPVMPTTTCVVIHDYQLKDLPEVSTSPGINNWIHVEYFFEGNPELEVVLPAGRYSIPNFSGGHVWEYNGCSLDQVTEQVTAHIERRIAQNANNGGWGDNSLFKLIG